MYSMECFVCFVVVVLLPFFLFRRYMMFLLFILFSCDTQLDVAQCPEISSTLRYVPHILTSYYIVSHLDHHWSPDSRQVLQHHFRILKYILGCFIQNICSHRTLKQLTERHVSQDSKQGVILGFLSEQLWALLPLSFCSQNTLDSSNLAFVPCTRFDFAINSGADTDVRRNPWSTLRVHCRMTIMNGLHNF